MGNSFSVFARRRRRCHLRRQKTSFRKRRLNSWSSTPLLELCKEEEAFLCFRIISPAFPSPLRPLVKPFAMATRSRASVLPFFVGLVLLCSATRAQVSVFVFSMGNFDIENSIRVEARIAKSLDDIYLGSGGRARVFRSLLLLPVLEYVHFMATGEVLKGEDGLWRVLRERDVLCTTVEKTKTPNNKYLVFLFSLAIAPTARPR